MSSSAAALQIDRLTVAYDAKPVLWDVSVSVARGVIMGVVGPNGAGKSTLLKAVLGLVPSLSGSVRVFDEVVSSATDQIGYVPQRTSVDWDFPTTVLDLVMMGTYGRVGWFRRPGAKERAASMEALEMVEMCDYVDRQIGELSGGQQQRVFLARAFVQDAPLYFMDEPFAGVDATTEKAIVTLLHGLRDRGKTLVVVHHDLSTICDYFDEVTLLNGRVIGSGPVNTAFTTELLEATYGGRIGQGLGDAGIGDRTSGEVGDGRKDDPS